VDQATTPARLWAQANEEHPTDRDARRVRYAELLVKYGHVVPRRPGDTSPLFPCGHNPRH